MTDIRTCEQCGTSFTPRREHARFCSPRCRVAAQRRMTEDTFGGLRFVRNQMGYAPDPADFIEPLELRPGTAAPRVAAWTWRAMPEPAAASPGHRAHGWELIRYRAYQRQLAGRPVGEALGQAVAFLRLAAESSSLSRA